jgi:hypothetical protein
MTEAGEENVVASGLCTNVTSTKLNNISKYQAPIFSIGTTCQPSCWLG